MDREIKKLNDIMVSLFNTVLKMEEKRADEVACCIEHIMTLEEISRFQLLTDRCRERGE